MMYREDFQPVYLTIHSLDMFAPAKVNGRETLAHLDTGANAPTVTPRFAEGLPRTGKMKIRSAFGREESEVVSVNVEFMGEVFRDVEARVSDPQKPFPFEWGVRLSAREIFARPIVFDFHVLAVLPAEAIDGGNWQKVPSNFLEVGLCMLEMEAGGRSLNVLFDTGAGISVINGRHLKEMGITVEPGFEMDVEDATGERRKVEAKVVRGLRLGGIEMPPFDAFVVELGLVEEYLGHRIDVVLGANAMLRGGLRWLFDREKSRVLVME